MDKPTISLLVPTWRNSWYLDITVRSAMQHCEPSTVEALIFSQEHDEETDRIVEGFQKDGLSARIIGTSPQNEGVALAVNACAEASVGDFKFYTGDDYYFLPGWDQALLRRIKPGEWQYLTPRSIEPEGTNPSMYAPHDFGRGPDDFRVNDLLKFWQGLKKQDVVSRWGPPFVSKAIWQAAGGFDTGYWPGFGTDADFAISVAKAANMAGEKASFLGVGDSGIYHFGCISTRRVRSYGATLAADTRFRNKWSMGTRDFAAQVGDGQVVE